MPYLMYQRIKQCGVIPVIRLVDNEGTARIYHQYGAATVYRLRRRTA